MMYDDDDQDIRERCLDRAVGAMGQGCPLDDYLTCAAGFEKYIVKGARTKGKSS